MEINIIAVVAANRAIGYQNDMVHFTSKDFKCFKRLTAEYTVIIGRKTSHLLPKDALPNRRNIVLSRTGTGSPGCSICSSLEGALKHIGTEEKASIISGASLHEEALAIADHLYLIEIATAPPQADVFLLEYNDGTWVIKSREGHPAIDDNSTYAFVNYVRG